MNKAIVLCNGQAPTKELLAEACEAADLVVAADGGAVTAKAYSIVPDVIIGDLDSIDPADYEDWGQTELIKIADQESNDLEKALEYCLAQHMDSVQILGATNKRLDHTLKNLSVLKQYQPKFKHIALVDDFGTMLVLPKKYEGQFKIGTQLSLFPLSGKVEGIRTEGLKYALNNEPLENGVRDGSSNEAISEKVGIQYTKGDLLLYIANERKED